ncbi:MAG: hypothetical protein HC933_03070 [Pleurocapsa sp. SU_196_0]|nr:hypothetical protein [Pleurocapsa sp. SU_196_0]
MDPHQRNKAPHFETRGAPVNRPEIIVEHAVSPFVAARARRVLHQLIQASPAVNTADQKHPSRALTRDGQENNMQTVNRHESTTPTLEPQPRAYTLESGATYTTSIQRHGMVLCHLTGTDCQVYVSCDFDGTPLEQPRFNHTAALSSVSLGMLVGEYERTERLSRHQTVRFAVSHQTYLNARDELERRGVAL